MFYLFLLSLYFFQFFMLLIIFFFASSLHLPINHLNNVYFYYVFVVSMVIKFVHNTKLECTLNFFTENVRLYHIFPKLYHFSLV